MRKDTAGPDGERRWNARRVVPATRKTVVFTGKGLFVTARLVGKASTAARHAVGKGAHRALGGHRYVRRAEDVNGRISDAFVRLDAALRFRDAEIARLRSENERLRSLLDNP